MYLSKVGDFTEAEGGEFAVFLWEVAIGSRGSMYEGELYWTSRDHVVPPGRERLAVVTERNEENKLWEELVADDGLENGAFSGALAADDHYARELETVALVYAEKHCAYFDELLGEMHETVLPCVESVVVCLGGVGGGRKGGGDKGGDGSIFLWRSVTGVVRVL